MGSLMAGWDSHVHHLRSDVASETLLCSYRSADQKFPNWRGTDHWTKEEIASFWRLKKMEEEELFFLKASYTHSKEDQKRNVINDESELVGGEEDSMEPLLKKHGWWISSKWAFLNEPPKKKSPDTSYNYVAQFHIARKHIDAFELYPSAKAITA